MLICPVGVLLMWGCTQSSDEGWVDLFNGRDLSGWVQKNGEALYEARDGMIVGTTVTGTPNSFLCTEQEYDDFILEVEMFLKDDFNSGIQFRSESRPDYKEGRVHGYQCEVDPSDRGWSAGIYDESRRGWLYPVDVNPQAKSTFRHGEWNHYRIECIGPSMKTWLNGEPVAHLIDDLTPRGFIALQVHAIREDSLADRQIMWRNIRIKTEDLVPSADEGIFVVNMLPNNLSGTEKAEGYRLLFDGVSTDHFKSIGGEEFPSQGWTVEDGTLVVNPGGGNHRGESGGSIITREEFGPFELKFDFMFAEGANSGIKYGLGNNGPALGLEYQILDDKNHPDAVEDPEGNRTLASLFGLIPARKEGRFVKGVGEWNRGRIILSPNDHVEHWLNGRKVLEFTRGSDEFNKLVENSRFVNAEGFGMSPKGPIHIQDANEEVRFRSIKIKNL